MNVKRKEVARITEGTGRRGGERAKKEREGEKEVMIEKESRKEEEGRKSDGKERK